MAPVGAGGPVPVIEEQADSRGDGFFARVEMDEAGNLAGGNSR